MASGHAFESALNSTGVSAGKLPGSHNGNPALALLVALEALHHVNAGQLAAHGHHDEHGERHREHEGLAPGF